MSNLAVFIDGEYLNRIAAHQRVWVDYAKLGEAIRRVVAANCQEPLNLLRTYYYDCLPYQGNPPTEEERKRFAGRRRFYTLLETLPNFEVKLGRLERRERDGKTVFQQKRVDLMLGLDMAGLAFKRRMSHAVLVSGDSDLLPAVEVAKEEGVVVYLAHGGWDTFHSELWRASDERIPFDQAFMNQVRRT